MKRLLITLLPFDFFNLDTSLAPAEILDRTYAIINGWHSSYYGNRTGNGFVLAQRVRRYFAGGRIHNSFAPVAYAKFKQAPGKTEISVKVMPYPFVCLILFPIYAMFLLAFLLSVIALIIDLVTLIAGGSDFIGLWEGLLFFPILWVLLFFTFKRPAKKLKNLLKEALVP